MVGDVLMNKIDRIVFFLRVVSLMEENEIK